MILCRFWERQSIKNRLKKVERINRGKRRQVEVLQRLVGFDARITYRDRLAGKDREWVEFSQGLGIGGSAQALHARRPKASADFLIMFLFIIRPPGHFQG